jgi:hypothetical protein
MECPWQSKAPKLPRLPWKLSAEALWAGLTLTPKSPSAAIDAFDDGFAPPNGFTPCSSRPWAAPDYLRDRVAQGSGS